MALSVECMRMQTEGNSALLQKTLLHTHTEVEVAENNCSLIDCPLSEQFGG